MATRTIDNNKKTTVHANIKRVCMFCEKKVEPDYADSITLRKYMSDRARIVAKSRTATCSKHQRALTKQIKYARHLSLLPFIARV